MEGSNQDSQEYIFKNQLAKPVDVSMMLDKMKIAIEGEKKETIKTLKLFSIFVLFRFKGKIGQCDKITN